jgi:tricorn protease interacting factor F2/3
MRVEGYDLFLDVDPGARAFRGTVEVHLTVDEPSVRLNALELELTKAELDGHPVEAVVDPARQEIVLPASAPGPHVARLEFRGQASEQGLTGLYVSPFGSSQEILTTQMYPTGARRLFPCLDHPARKAEFRVAIRTPKESHVVFNTDPSGVEENGSHRTTRFHPTPRMSTYLLYLGIGPFEESERSQGGLRTIVAHPKGRGADAQFALDHASRFVREYESYYAIPYPLPKLHLVAVPSFWAGAMENWGAIAFRETTLLVDGRTSSFSTRWNRQVLAHEIAHQWFGNLVTNAWWDDFWLNEAFATFVANRIIDRVHPGESTWSDFVLTESGRGFVPDALESAHPIQVPIHAPEQIGEIADGITYGKGSNVLRMIESYLGEPAFRAGVTAYLKEHSFDTATADDLWSALDRHSGVPVSRIMRSWITRPGHPLVEVQRRDGALHFSQRRFRYDGKIDPTTWPIPMEAEVGGQRHRFLLEDAPFSLPCGDQELVRINPDRPGFFHTRLDGELGGATVRAWDQLSEIDQWGLLVDRLFFLTSGDGDLDEYLEAVERAGTGSTYLPALTAAGQLRGLANFLPTVRRLAEAHPRFFRRQLERVGLTARPGEPAPTGVLREALGLGMVDSLEAETRTLAEAFHRGEAGIDRDLLDAATIAYVRIGGPSAWDEIRARIPSASSDEVAQRLASALAHTLDRDRFDATLALLETPELSASRIWDVLGSARGNFRFHDRLWTWMARELPTLDTRWQGTPLLSACLAAAIPSVGLGRSDELRGYFASHRFPEADRGIREGLERLGHRERLAARLRAAA